MECVILVKGTGKGGLKKDWTGTVKEAIKDWDIFYRAVLNHVKSCESCDPTDVLQAYWNNRQRPKHKGSISIGLSGLALRYMRIGADPVLVKRFVSKSTVLEHIIKSNLFTNKEIYDVVYKHINHTGDADKWAREYAVSVVDNNKKDDPFLQAISLVLQAGLTPPYEDLERLAVVAEVTLS